MVGFVVKGMDLVIGGVFEVNEYIFINFKEVGKLFIGEFCDGLI